MTETIRILGIDPGSRTTGFGLIDVCGAVTRPVEWGGIATSGEHSDRLKDIFRSLAGIVADFTPAEIAIERVFIHRNADSALKLGQARAAALCATFAADLPVFEYTARHIKKAVVGRGGAEKGQVQHMVKLILGLREDVAEDAADALAAALCHAHQRGARSVIDQVASKP